VATVGDVFDDEDIFLSPVFLFWDCFQCEFPFLCWMTVLVSKPCCCLQGSPIWCSPFLFFIGYERNYPTLFWTGKTKQALEYTSSKKVEETFNDFGNMLPNFRC